jgi:hypothetical protein
MVRSIHEEIFSSMKKNDTEEFRVRMAFLAKKYRDVISDSKAADQGVPSDRSGLRAPQVTVFRRQVFRRLLTGLFALYNRSSLNSFTSVVNLSRSCSAAIRAASSRNLSVLSRPRCTEVILALLGV